MAVEGWKLLEKACTDTVWGSLWEGPNESIIFQVYLSIVIGVLAALSVSFREETWYLIVQTMILVLPGAERTPADITEFPVKIMKPQPQSPRKDWDISLSLNSMQFKWLYAFKEQDIRSSYECWCSQEYAWKVWIRDETRF